MDIVIKGRNLQVTDTLRDYIEGKVGRLERYMDGVDETRVEVSRQNHKSSGDRHKVQLTLRRGGTILRAEDQSSDVRTSVDAVLDKMSRQVERYKGKHWRAHTRAARESEAAEQEEVAETDLVRVKRFRTQPMDVDEAIEQMELLSHDFFIFYGVDEQEFCVVYRRRDGGYGLLVPEMA